MEIVVKDFSETTSTSILKVGTNIRYDKLYCIKESAIIAYQSHSLSFFFLSNELKWMATAILIFLMTLKSVLPFILLNLSPKSS